MTVNYVVDVTRTSWDCLVGHIRGFPRHPTPPQRSMAALEEYCTEFLAKHTAYPFKVIYNTPEETQMLLRSTFDVDLIQTMGSDEMVARAARVSTGRDQLEQEKIEGLIGYLARENHTTPFESCTATFRVTAPMFVVQQILRHRTLSYSALSHRYTEATPEFYVPDPDRPLKNAGSSAHPNLVADDSITYGEVLSLHEGAVKDAWDYYVCLIELGVANEVARNVLPANLYTSLYMTGNLLNWIKFLRLRNGTHGHPQYEIAEVANEIQYQLTKKFPLSMTAFFQGESE